MSALRKIPRELFGLFVDDGSFALTILAWVALLTLPFARTGWLPAWRGPILFVGLAFILAASAVRYARREAGS